MLSNIAKLIDAAPAVVAIACGIAILVSGSAVVVVSTLRTGGLL